MGPLPSLMCCWKYSVLRSVVKVTVGSLGRIINWSCDVAWDKESVWISETGVDGRLCCMILGIRLVTGVLMWQSRLCLLTMRLFLSCIRWVGHMVHTVYRHRQVLQTSSRAQVNRGCCRKGWLGLPRDRLGKQLGQK
jgi:hypothetical protein